MVLLAPSKVREIGFVATAGVAAQNVPQITLLCVPNHMRVQITKITAVPLRSVKNSGEEKDSVIKVSTTHTHILRNASHRPKANV